MQNSKDISVQVKCLACRKDFQVRVDHPGKVLAAWQNHDRCPMCTSSGKEIKK
jgi:Zn finger protein HypA/HybF involved in hydrogenase expression